MKSTLQFVLSLLLVTVTLPVHTSSAQEAGDRKSVVQIANIGNSDDAEIFSVIRKIFMERNSGYDMTYLAGVRQVELKAHTQVVFVQEIEGVTDQEGKGVATVTGRTGETKVSEAIVGDILILHEDERLRFDVEMGLLVFDVPVRPQHELPTFIRPDWDPEITDVPGGCATDIDAYRRILLTWDEDVGTYIYHALNAHRVRIRDSFSHYHPVDGGFDEFYLVQMTEPGARIYISEKTSLITSPDTLEESQLNELIREYELEVGDLVYLPRGVIHRGFGGVVAQVITIPGFIPGSEIGVDHHLRKINERFSLYGEEALPYNLEASEEAVIR